jgi:hypothetical protein
MSKARDLANAGTALTTVSATELGYLDGVTSAVQTQVDGKEPTLPSQTGNTGKYLTTDGSAKSWGTVSQYALPSQTGNAGKFLGTDGTNESWVSTVVDRSSSNWLQLFENVDPANTNNPASFSGMTKDSSGNIYTVGTITYTVSTNRIILIVKTNPLGEELLSITLGLTSGNTESQKERIAVDASGNIYVSGGFNDSSNRKRGFVAKLTSAGAITWTKTFDSDTTTSDEYVAGLGIDSSGNVFVSGQYWGNDKGNLFTVRLDSSGNVVWARRIIESNAVGIQPYGMALSSSFIYTYGRVYRGTGNGYDMFVAKYDLSGTLQWKNAYTGTGNTYEAIYNGTVDASDNLYLVGESISGNATILKLDSSGAVTFSKRLTTSATNFNAVHLDSTNGHVYALGYANITIGSSADAQCLLIIKYDTSGNIIYQRLIKNPSSSNNILAAITSGSYLYFGGLGRYVNSQSSAVLGRLNISGSGTQRFQVGSKKLSFDTSSFAEASGFLTGASWSSGTESGLSLTYGTYSFNVDISYAATSIGYF